MQHSWVVMLPAGGAERSAVSLSSIFMSSASAFCFFFPFGAAELAVSPLTSFNRLLDVTTSRNDNTCYIAQHYFKAEQHSFCSTA